MGVMPKRDKTLTDFGRNVSRLRSDAGLSQDKLAEKADLAPENSTEGSKEHGGMPFLFFLIREYRFAMISKEIGVRIGKFFGQTNRAAFKRDKILLQRRLREKTFEPFA